MSTQTSKKKGCQVTAVCSALRIQHSMHTSLLFLPNTLNVPFTSEQPPDTSPFWVRRSLLRRKEREHGDHSWKSPAAFTWNWFQSRALRLTKSPGGSDQPPTHTPTTQTWMGCFQCCWLRQWKTGGAYKHGQMVHRIISLVGRCTLGNHVSSEFSLQDKNYIMAADRQKERH